MYLDDNYLLIEWLILFLLFDFQSMDDSETEREEQTPAPAKKKCLFDDSIVGKVCKLFVMPW